MKKYILICSIVLGWATASVAQEFTKMTDIQFPGIKYGDVDWGDYDNDGDLDILLVGLNINERVSKIYRNNGNGTFTEQTQINLVGIAGSCAWGDYDNDGYLDIAIMGNTNSGFASKVYRNNGDNSFTDQTQIYLIYMEYGDISWRDYDNDGDLDLLLAASSQSTIYNNNGNNTFTKQSQIQFEGYGSVDWGDYDNDGDLDILFASHSRSKIYCNNGNNTFTKQTQIQLDGVVFNSVAWGDYDNDSYLDILLAGRLENEKRVSKIYHNNGNNTFTEQQQIQLIGVEMGHVSWADYDNDGDLDVLIIGQDNNFNKQSKIYRNNGNNSFTEQTQIQLTGVYTGDVAWGDYDNDGDLDFFLTGDDYYKPISEIYRNNASVPNKKPNTINNLKTTSIGSSVTFTWDIPNDVNQTSGVSYNLYLYKELNNKYIITPHAFAQNSTKNGKRLLSQIGSIQTNSYTINSLSDGNYKWSVQAIDASFAGGEFAPEQPVTVQCNTPITQVRKISVKNIDYTSATIDSTDFTSDADGYVLFLNTTDTFDSPVDGNIYTPNTAWQNNGQQCIYAGNSKNPNIVISLLTHNTKYYLKAYTYNRCNNTYTYNSTGGTLADFTTLFCTAPALPVEKIGLRNIKKFSTVLDSVIFSLSNANGYIVFINKTNTWSAPADGSNYTPNKKWQNKGQQCVYKGNQIRPNITIDSLTDNTIYYIKVYTYNYCLNTNKYNPNGTEISFKTELCQALPANKITTKNIYAFSATIDSVVVLSGNAEGYVVFINNTNTWTLPTNGTTFTPNTTWQNKGQQCLYQGNKTKPNINVDSLTDNTTYYVKIYTYNYCLNTYKYEKQGIETSFTTKSCNTPTKTINLLLINSYTPISLQIDSIITSTTGKANGYILFINTIDTLIPPVDATNYTPNTIWNNEGQQCVYIGNNKKPKVSITGLMTDTRYYITAYTYNICDTYYKKYNPTGKKTVASTPPAQFQKQNDIEFNETAYYGSWGDYDNDGDLDLYSVSSFPDAYEGDSSKVILYQNNSDNSFTQLLENQKQGSFTGNVQFTDYDNDNNVNGSLMGFFGYTYGQWEEVLHEDWRDSCWLVCPYVDWCYTECVTIYETWYETEYVEYWTQEEVGPSWNGGTWGDYDNDGDLDVLGINTSIYQNTDSAFNIKQYIGGNDWGDYDNDGDLDVLNTNAIYQNTGKNFIKIADVGGNAWGDYDNDGDLDVLADNKVYQNTGSNFVQIADVGGIAWGDYDNDGLLDILSQQAVYKNMGQGKFVPTQLFAHAAMWADYDNDSDLDVMAKSYEYGSFTLYQNTAQANIAPTAPTNLQTTQHDDYVEFTWDAATDVNQTGGLSYNLYVYNNDTKTYAKSPQSFVGVNDSLNGNRLIVQRGHIQGTSYKLWLPNGNYSWSVQAIDASFAGGKFAPEQIFTFECTAPTIAVSNMAIENVTTHNIGIQSVTLSSPDIEGYVIFINDTNSFTPPTNGQTFVADKKWQHNGQQCVYVGNNLQPQINIWQLDYATNYYIRVYTYNRCQKYNNAYYAIEQSTVKCYAPIATVSNMTLSNITGHSIDIQSVTLPSEPFSGYVIFINDTNAFIPPTNGQMIFGDNSWNNNGQQCLYNGNELQPKIRITELDYNTTYYIRIYTYNACFDYVNYSDTTYAIQQTTPYETFTPMATTLLPNSIGGSLSWGDYDNDGYLDFLVSNKIYRNNGDNTFVEQTQTQLPQIIINFSTWGDYDNDGDLDILLTGWGGMGIWLAKIYRNNGNNSFTELTEIQINNNVRNAACDDYDNDGDLDILLNDFVDAAVLTSKMYNNNSNHSFTQQTNIQLSGAESFAWGDYDNDGNLDILLTGYDYDSNKDVTKIYRNNGNNTFTEQTQIQLTSNVHDVAWGDYDNDGYLDILLTGNDTKIYRNNGDNTFTDQINIQLTGIFWGKGNWIDYDNDGYLDISFLDYGSPLKIYHNNGNNTFTQQPNIQLLPFNEKLGIWGDYDNDNDLDFLLNTNNSIIYRNNSTKLNTIPNAPTNLQNTINNNNVTLTWNAATDANQNGGHSYNVYVRNTDNNKLVVTPMANTTTGKRLVASRGSIQTTTKTFYLPKGNYVWAVQAIDNSFAGSPFSAEQTFSIVTGIESVDVKFDILPNPASDKLLINVGTSTDFTVQLIGIDGMMYEQLKFTNQSQALLTRLPHQSGLYFVRVITPNGVGTQKVMIQRK